MFYPSLQTLLFLYSISKAQSHFHLLHKAIQSLLTNVRKGIQVEGIAHAGLIGMNYKGSFRELQTDEVAEGVRQRYSSKYLINDSPGG